MERTILFCFPYAGGSASVFNKWAKYVDSEITLCPVELPGRGNRYNLPLYDNIDDLINDALNSVSSKISQAKFALWGHSMGGILAYEVAHKIRAANLSNPIHLFVSGMSAPHIIEARRSVHNLPENEFIEEILNLGGTPSEVFENKELSNLFMPILRADYKVVDNYKYRCRSRLNCDITIIHGIDDDSIKSNLDEWRMHTDSNFALYELEGNHFFIFDNIVEIAKIINEALK